MTHRTPVFQMAYVKFKLMTFYVTTDEADYGIVVSIHQVLLMAFERK